MDEATLEQQMKQAVSHSVGRRADSAYLGNKPAYPTTAAEPQPPSVTTLDDVLQSVRILRQKLYEEAGTATRMTEATYGEGVYPKEETSPHVGATTVPSMIHAELAECHRALELLHENMMRIDHVLRIDDPSSATRIR